MSIINEITQSFLLHKGGEACIYKIISRGKPYTLKLYSKNSHFDIQLMNTLLQEHIVGLYKIIELGKRGNYSYIIYEFIEGIPSDKIDKVPIAIAINILRELIVILRQLLKKGISHGDLNPSNVIFNKEGKVFLIDLGIIGLGSLPYASFERFQGKLPNEKSDIYSLGLLLFRLIAGEDFVKGNTYEEYASKSSEIESFSPTDFLFESLNISDDSIEEINALEPIWKSVLKPNPNNRVEDFEEFDELLEIAFNKIYGGSVSWLIRKKKFCESLQGKIGTKSSKENEICVLPIDFCPLKLFKRNKWFLLFITIGLLLVVSFLLMVLWPKSLGVDEMGYEMLQRTRSLEYGDKLDNSINYEGEIPKSVLDSIPMPKKLK